MSAGNHAQALASYAQQLNIPTVIVMPRYTPNTKIEQTRSFGAKVMVMGEDFQELVKSLRGWQQKGGFTLSIRTMMN